MKNLNANQKIDKNGNELKLCDRVLVFLNNDPYQTVCTIVGAHHGRLKMKAQFTYNICIEFSNRVELIEE
jgi:hypothetical protein